MRKIFVVGAILFFSSMLLAAQKKSAAQGILQNASDVNQTLLPLEVYVGDKAEIRYTFRSAVDYFSDSNINKDIDVTKFPFGEMQNEFTVKSAHFVRNDMEYAITMQIVPWRPGLIEFPSFDLFSVLSMNEAEKNKNISYAIAFEPIEIKSIVEKTGRNEMQKPFAPLIIPGTTYVIFAFVVLAVILLAFAFRMLLKFGDIKRWVENLKQRYANRRNSIIALRKIKRIARSSNLSDIEFCASLQNITRSYLSFRFDYPFNSTSAKGMREAFYNICVGDIPASIAYTVEDLCSMFVRTDYIRYAHDSIDSTLEPLREHQAKLAENERISLSQMVIKAINIFESDSYDEEENNVF